MSQPDELPQDTRPYLPVPHDLLIRPRYLTILLMPVLVLIASEYLLGAYGDTTLVIGVQSLTATPMAELGARYIFLAVFFLYSALALVFMAMFGFDLWTRHCSRSIIYTVLGMICVIAISLLFSTIEPIWMGSFESYQLLGSDLFEAALGDGYIPACTTHLAHVCDGRGAFFAMTYLLDKANLITSFAAAAVIAGLVLALARPSAADLSTQQGLDNEAAILFAAENTARRYLYASAMLLTVGMALGLAWMNWPAAMIADDALRGEYQRLVAGISTFRGVSYSVLILSYYIPVMLILTVRIDRFRTAAADRGQGDLAAPLTGFDLTKLTSPEALKAMLAIASPTLATGVSDLFSLIG